MDKLKQSQKEVNESLINLMCLTFNKKEMKRLIEAYILTNNLTAEITTLKEKLDNK